MIYDNLTAFLFPAFRPSRNAVGSIAHLSIRYPQLHSWLPASLDNTARTHANHRAERAEAHMDGQAHQPLRYSDTHSKRQLRTIYHSVEPFLSRNWLSNRPGANRFPGTNEVVPFTV